MRERKDSALPCTRCRSMDAGAIEGRTRLSLTVQGLPSTHANKIVGHSMSYLLS